MFMFPEEPPIDYYVADVQPTFLTDGVLRQWRIGPTHKCIAKQLKPVRRKLTDSVAPMPQLDTRVLEEETVNQRDGYVDRCTRVGPMLQESITFMPRHKISVKAAQNAVSTFPRSIQYELWYTDEGEIKDREGNQICRTKSVETQEKTKSVCEHCTLLAPAFSLSNAADSTMKSSEKHKICKGMDCKAQQLCDLHTEEKVEENEADLPSKIKETGSESMETTQISFTNKKVATVCRSDAYRSVWNEQKNENESRGISCEEDIDKDKRWQPLCETISLPRRSEEREEELRQLTKPFLHDLHVWYSINKATKLSPPIRVQGKRPILEWRFSHL